MSGTGRNSVAGRIRLLDARLEAIAQHLCIDLRADSHNLCARRTLAPPIQLADLGSSSHDLQGETFVRVVSGVDDALASVNGCRQFPSHHLAQRFERERPIGFEAPPFKHAAMRNICS